MDGEGKRSAADVWLLLIVAGYALAKAVYRVFWPAREMRLAPAMQLGLAFDVALLVVLIWLGRRLRRDRGEGGEAGPAELAMWVGVAACAVMISIRLFTYDGWYSGHLRCCDLSWMR